jgi:hypothetical protein
LSLSKDSRHLSYLTVPFTSRLYVALFGRIRSKEHQAAARWEEAQVLVESAGAPVGLLAQAEEQLLASRKTAQHIRFGDEDAASESSSGESEPETRPAKRQKAEGGVPVNREGKCPYPSRAEELADTEAKRKERLEQIKQMRVAGSQGGAKPSKKGPAQMTPPEVKSFVAKTRRLCEGGDDVQGFLTRLLPPVPTLKGKTPEARRSKKASKERRRVVNALLTPAGKGLLHVAVRCMVGECEGGLTKKEKRQAGTEAAPIDLEKLGEAPSEVKKLEQGAEAMRREIEKLEQRLGAAGGANSPGAKGGGAVEEGQLLAYAISHFQQEWDQESDSQVKRQIWSPLSWAQRCESDMRAHFAGGGDSHPSEKSGPLGKVGVPSLLSLLSTCVDKLPASMALQLGLAPGDEGGAEIAGNAPPRQRVLRVVEEVLSMRGGSQEKQKEVREAVRAALCAQFEVAYVEQLGWGPVEDLVRQAKQGGAGDGSSTVLYTGPLLQSELSGGAILPGPEGAPVFSERVAGRLGAVTEEQAQRAIDAVPALADVAGATQWEAVFQPTLGPLLDYLECRAKSDSCRFLALPHGSVLKLPLESAADAFLEAAIRGEARKAAGALVAVIAEYGGFKRSPIALLQAHATSALQILFKTAEGDSEKRTAHFPAGDFVLDCLEVCPKALRPCVAEVLLPALSAVTGNAAKVLLSRASEAQRTMLHGLGLERGVAEWIDDFRATIWRSEGAIQREDQAGGESSKGAQEGEGTEGPATVEVIEKRVLETANAGVSMKGEKGEENSNKVLLQRTPEAAPNPSIMDSACQAGGRERMNSTLEERGSGTAEPICQEGGQSQGSLEAEARAVVESIRREEFGLGYELGAAESALMARQHERMGRALQRLSSELYSGDSHFVLELVQVGTGP